MSAAAFTLSSDHVGLGTMDLLKDPLRNSVQLPVFQHSG
jgi:hypothetical protein